MFIIKTIILLTIFGTSLSLGIMFSKKYSNRVKTLKELNSALNIFLTKIKYTYEPIPDIFEEISKNTYKNVSNLFYDLSQKMKNTEAGTAWLNSIEESNLEINEEDKNILKGLSKLLGKTNLEGQVSEIELTQSFLKKQIEYAEQERQKNEKLYKTLGMTIGLAIVILLA